MSRNPAARIGESSLELQARAGRAMKREHGNAVRVAQLEPTLSLPSGKTVTHESRMRAPYEPPSTSRRSPRPASARLIGRRCQAKRLIAIARITIFGESCRDRADAELTSGAARRV